MDCSVCIRNSPALADYFFVIKAVTAMEYTPKGGIFQVNTLLYSQKYPCFSKNHLTRRQKRIILVEMNGAVAQLARAIRSHRIGHGFDSHQLHHFIAYHGDFSPFFPRLGCFRII